MDNLIPLENWMQTAINNLAPTARRRLMRRLGVIVRKFNQSNITKQQGPDGQKWAPRKKRTNRHGEIAQKKKMMMGLRQARRLRIDTTDTGVHVGFRARNAKIAALHHSGGMDYVAPDGPKVNYPARPLLGFSNELLDLIGDEILNHIVS